MKCLSLWQPWASLIAIGAKRIETRSWSTSYHGPVAIHAAKHWTRELRDLCFEDSFWRVLVGDGVEHRHHDPSVCDEMVHDRLPRGVLIAVAELIGVVPITAEFAAVIPDDERAFGDYTPGRFAWVMLDVRVLDAPIPFRARQGLFDITDPEILAALPASAPAEAA